jgi:PAS domain S-box-containing protein
MDEHPVQILLVEDEEAHAEMARRAFAAHGGRFHLTIAGSLAEARTRLAEASPSLVIADLRLPDGLGTDLMPAKVNGHVVPLVVMTSQGDERAAVESMKAGALDYVVKSDAVLAEAPHIAERALREWENISERRRTEEALRLSEGRYQKIFDNSNDAVFLIDPELDIIVEVNPRACSMLAYTRNELLSVPISTVHPGKNMNELRGLAESVFETGRGWTDELTCHTKDGRTLPAEISASSIDIGGRPHMIAMVRDVTERRRAEKALNYSKARSAAILESASEGILVVDVAGDIVIVNARTEALFGYSRDELAGHPVEMLIPEYLQRNHAAHRRRFFSDPHRRVMGANLGCFGRCKDGSQFPVDISLNSVETEEGVLAIVCIVDQTERHRVEAEVQKLSRAVEQVSVAVALTDVQGRFEYVNPAFTQISGYSLEDVKGKNPSILKSGLTSQEEYSHLWKTILSGGEWRGEFQNKKKDGELFWASASISSIKNPKGIITHFIAVEEDITGRKRAEEALSRLAEETALVAEIGRIISSSLDIDEVYERFCQEVRKLITFDRIAINLVDPENHTFSSTYVLGTETQGMQRWQTFPMAGSLVERAVRTRSAQTAHFQSEEELAREIPRLMASYKAGFVSFLAVPLVSKGEVVGVIFFQSTKHGGYSERDVALAGRVGAQIAGTIANARLYAQRLLAEDRLRASLNEKEVLVKEINHRVKNNLQIISSLLSLQSRDIQDHKALQVFKVSQDRIKAMALVHEMLYQSEDLGRINFGEYLSSLTSDLYSAYGLSTQGIDLKLDVERIFLGVDTAIPCGLIVNELVSNSLKHAFPDGAPGEISVSVRAADDQFTMVVKDSGVGLPDGLDIQQLKTLGLTIVNALAQQISGAIDLSSQGGSRISITFPVP